MPVLISDIKKIESVQAKFTRYLCKKLNIKFSNYTDRLNILQLETLEIRRLKFDLILAYKILNNYVDLDPNHFFTHSTCLELYSLRRHQHHLQKPNLAKTAIRNNFYSYRIVNTWNQLPDKIVTANSLQSFKIQLNAINLYEFYTTKL